MNAPKRPDGVAHISEALEKEKTYLERADIFERMESGHEGELKNSLARVARAAVEGFVMELHKRISIRHIDKNPALKRELLAAANAMLAATNERNVAAAGEGKPSS